MLSLRYLAYILTALPEPHPTYLLVVSKVTPVHINLDFSRSFEVPINTRIPKHSVLMTLLIYF